MESTAFYSVFNLKSYSSVSFMIESLTIDSNLELFREDAASSDISLITYW